jgi:hypothetical protein
MNESLDGWRPVWPVLRRDGTAEDACTCRNCTVAAECKGCGSVYRQVTICSSGDPAFPPTYVVEEWHSFRCPVALNPPEGVVRLDLIPKERDLGPRNRFEPIGAHRAPFLDTRQWAGQTWLYRAFDERGELLYVGITGNVAGRMRTHRCSSPWWPRCDYVELAVYATRAEAAGAERRAIRTELPAFNIQD